MPSTATNTARVIETTNEEVNVILENTTPTNTVTKEELTPEQVKTLIENTYNISMKEAEIRNYTTGFTKGFSFLFDLKSNEGKPRTEAVLPVFVGVTVSDRVGTAYSYNAQSPTHNQGKNAIPAPLTRQLLKNYAEEKVATLLRELCQVKGDEFQAWKYFLELVERDHEAITFTSKDPEGNYQALVNTINARLEQHERNQTKELMPLNYLFGNFSNVTFLLKIPTTIDLPTMNLSEELKHSVVLQFSVSYSLETQRLETEISIRGSETPHQHVTELSSLLETLGQYDWSID